MTNFKNVNVIQHDDVKSILKKRHDIEGLDFNDDMQIICHDKYGNPDIMTISEQMNYIIKQGIWGFIHDTNIHIWYNSEVSLENLIYFFSHELGHITGECENDPIKEEIRVEQYSNVALNAYILAKQIKK